MDIMQLGTSLLSEKLGLDLDSNDISSALGGLLANDNGDVDLAGLVGKMSSGDLGSVVSSWLGDGANEAISPESLAAVFDSEKLAAFAGKLGLDADAAAGGLAEALPELMDKSSSGGSLLDMVGGADGLLGAAKSFFK